MLFNSTGPKKATYKNIGYWDTSGSYRRNIRLLALGNQEKLLKKNPNYEQIIKSIISKYDTTVNIEKLEAEINSALLLSSNITKTKNFSAEFILEFMYDLNIFENFNFGKHKGMKEILSYQIANRICQPSSIFKSFINKSESYTDLDYSKNSFYRMLDLLEDNKENILKNISKKFVNENETIFFDSTTIYFESFKKEELRLPGYSKDGKFKEDQIVLAMACNSENIPIFYKIFPGNTADVKTLIPFIQEFKEIYKNTKITVVSDRGMSSAENINFLEENNIDYIISKRANIETKKYKEFLLKEDDYVEISGKFKYKTKEIFVENKENKGKIRKQIVTWSKSRAKLDKLNRENEINNFIKNQDKNGFVNEKRMIGYKKTKHFKQLNSSKYVLDEEKISNDQKFDGYYVYETSLKDLDPLKVVEIYSMQWKIEENFRTLKNNLQIRPMYVYTTKHIQGHVLFSFLSLWILKMFLLKIKNFYKDNGIIQKITDEKFILILKNLIYMTEEDRNSNKLLTFKRLDNELSVMAWNFYDEYIKYIK
ncbi:IS1634 family transposase [Mycoplasma sp. 480]|uniref:IS1634 family transposase n=1 Tax=Mycoplasma sp. 480 TaxID=3440155 RepID=UPI003F513B87